LHFMPFKKTTQVGLHIDSEGIHLLQLSRVRRHLHIENFLTADCTAETIRQGKITSWEIVQSVLSEWVARHRLQGVATTIALPASLVRMQHIHLPKGLTKKEIENEIRLQIPRDNADLAAALEIDFSIVPEKNLTEYKVFFALTERTYLTDYVHKMSQTGLAIKRVDVDIYALARAMLYPTPKSAIEDVILLHGSRSQVSFLVVHHATHIVYYQQWEITALAHDWMPLKKAWQFCLATHPYLNLAPVKLQGLPQPLAASVVSFITHEWGMSVSYPQPYAAMKLAAHVEKSTLPLISLGLALRGAP
jgi:Tfp pilus assembly PilM family ATPase